MHTKDVVQKGGDGRSRTTQSDVDGNGTFDRSEVISVDGTGASVATVTTYNDDGTTVSKLVSTTSASGLSRTNQYDLNADGTFDVTTSNNVVINTNGSSTTTHTATNANGSLRDKLVQTRSADGLSTSTQADTNGDGVFELATTDATVLNADGSKTQTVTDTNADGSLRSKRTMLVSSDRQTTTINRDTNGDGVNDQTGTTQIQANGNVVNTRTSLTAGGALINKVVATTSANGLSQTVQSDFNGDGVYDLTSSGVAVLNANGSRTTTSTNTSANGTVLGKAVTTVSATGLSTTSQSDRNGDGVFELTNTDNGVLNADGSRTDTVTSTSSNGTVLGKTLTTVSATGLSTTTRVDVNGDSTFDIATTDVTTLEADGGRRHTVTVTNADGSLRSRSVTLVADDLRSSSSSLDSDGDGAVEATVATATKANGDVTVTRSELEDCGCLISQTVETTSANGLVHKVERDFNGDGVFDTRQADVAVLNADGSVKVTHTTTNADSSVRGTAVETASDDGLSHTVAIDADGSGSYETTRADVIVLNSNGSRTETVTTTNANGSLRSKDVAVTSDDGETVSVTRDLNGDGITDRTGTKTTSTNGDVVETRSNLTSTGALINKVVETTNANNFASKQERDLNGDGILDRVQSRSSALNADGSRTTTFTDKAYSGAGGSVMTLKSSVVSTVSGNGYSQSYSYDGQSPSWSANLFKRTATDLTTFNADGSATDTISTFNAASTLLDRSTTTATGNGLQTTAGLDLNGDGSVEKSRTMTIAADGAVSDVMQVRSTSGSLVLAEQAFTSRDGLTVHQTLDTDGDSAFDRLHDTVVNCDQSVTQTWANKTATGGLKDQAVLTTSADGLSNTLVVDSNGDGATDVKSTSDTTLNADGSRTTVVSTYDGDCDLLKRVTTVTSDDGLTESSTADTNGDWVTDFTTVSTTVLGADGTKTTTLVSRQANGALRQNVTLTVSADERTTTRQIDSDGDGRNDKVVTTVLNADETQSETTQYYSSGTSTGSVVQTKSADGLTEKWQWNNGALETKELIAGANGSYVWTHTEGTATTSVAHAISLNGVDTWTSNQGGVTRTATIDLSTEAYYQDLATRVAGVVLGRQLTGMESETLLKYISNGTLNSGQMAADLLATNEFAQRYGTLTDAAFIDLLFRNALDHSPTLADLSTYLTGLANGTLTRAAAAVAIANSAENLINGDEKAAEQKKSGSETYTLEHITDQALALNLVARIYDVTLDRAATSTEASNQAQSMVGGTQSPVQLATSLLASSEFATSNPGTLSNSDFVTKMFLNAFNQGPTSLEAQQWITALDNNQISRADLVLAIAKSTDHVVVSTTAVVGTSGADSLVGNASSNLLYGLSGNDSMAGNAGDDTLVGGAGADQLDGGAGSDTVSYATAASGVTADLSSATANTGDAQGDTYVSVENLEGSAYGDILTGTTGNNVLWGREGNDVLHGGDGDDSLEGGAGADVLDGGVGWDRVKYGSSSSGVVVDRTTPGNSTGEAAGDTYSGIEVFELTSYNDRFVGSADSEQVLGHDGNDTLIGGGGDDGLTGGAGADSLDGGAGFDTANYYWESSAVTVDLLTPANNLGAAVGDTFVNIESYQLTDGFNDRFVGTDGAEWAYGGGGNDTLIGNGGDDHLDGEEGNDRIVAGSGNDVLLGGDGDDSLEGGAGADVLDGGVGWDRVTYSASSSAVVVDRMAPGNSTGEAVGDTYSGIEVFELTSYNDRFVGSADAEQIFGFAGNDTLLGGGGDDWLTGGIGADNLDGGIGFDAANYAWESSAVTVDLLTPANNVGAAVGDTFVNIEKYQLTEGFDDRFVGTNGAEWAYGGGGNDTLIGNGGDDHLDGEAGNDRIVAGQGDDDLWGGSGSDTLVFGPSTGDDYVYDFAPGQDVIEINGVTMATSFSQVMSNAWEGNGFTQLNFGGLDGVRLFGVTKAQLSQADFRFT